MTTIRQGIEVLLREGLKRFLKKGVAFLYHNYIWPNLPETTEYRQLQGVKALPRKRLFETALPFTTPASDQSEDPAYNAMICRHVSEGDSVVLVGGGWGVSTVIAANSVGDTGHVHTYEAADTMYSRVQAAVRINGVEDRVSVTHGVVSDVCQLMGEENDEGAKVIQSDDLPDCDALLIDCDGCEVGLLNDLEKLPQCLIVEHHAVNGGDGAVDYQPDELERQINERGYEVTDREVGEIPEHEPFGTEETIFAAKRIDRY